MHNIVNLILQGKGGIGKSFIATLIAQYAIHKEPEQVVTGYDTDQENTTFAQYQGLYVEHIPVMTPDREINSKKFDVLIEKLLSGTGIAIVDNGANTFAPLLAYIQENDVINLLEENGKKVFIHTIVGGGDVMSDTANGFNSIANCTNASIVLWLNEHFGEMVTNEGKHFTETKVFNTHRDRIVGVVNLKMRKSTTFGDDIRRMTSRRFTIKDVMDSEEFSIMEKQRMTTFARETYAELDKIDWRWK